jgi:hypothetical protein
LNYVAVEVFDTPVVRLDLLNETFCAGDHCLPIWQNLNFVTNANQAG